MTIKSEAVLQNSTQRKVQKSLFGRLYISLMDIEFARYCAEFLLKKKWHHQPWGKKQSIYHQQSAFTTALVVAYSRPFTKSKGWPDFPTRLLKIYTKAEKDLHKRLIGMRHTIYAHTDSSLHDARPFFGVIKATMIRQPAFLITAEDGLLFLSMTEKLKTNINEALQVLTKELERENSSTGFATEH